jgi:hypothetical protein
VHLIGFTVEKAIFSFSSFFFHKHLLTLYWNCIDTVLTLLTLYWHCTDTVLTLYWHYWHCTDTILTLYWHYTDTVLTMYWHCTDTVLTLYWHYWHYWHCTDTVLTLYWHCTDTVLTLYWLSVFTSNIGPQTDASRHVNRYLFSNHLSVITQCLRYQNVCTSHTFHDRRIFVIHTRSTTGCLTLN